MANPQRENGFTAIANELYEAILRASLTDAQHRIIFAVIRKTYGYHKKSNSISIKDLIFYTHLNKRTVIYTVQNLEAKKILVVNRPKIGRGFKNYISLQKDYSLWDLSASTPHYKKMISRLKNMNRRVKQEITIIKRTSMPVDNLVDNSDKPPERVACIAPERVACIAPERVACIAPERVACIAPTKEINKDIYKDKYQPSAASRPVNNSINPLLKQAFDRAQAAGLNIYALLGQLRRERGWSAGKMFPEEVLLEICEDFLKRKDIIKAPWPYFKKALSLACDRWQADQNVQEAAIYKKEPAWISVESILALTGKMGKEEE